MYAMKYVHKNECAERGALKNVAREVEILSKLEHPCLVNLWFSFQDEEDLFMVSDLLLGGDLRYHIQQEQVAFGEESVVLFVAEIALALDYLQTNRIIHRDIKPDNILLDEEGHAHVTDFNIATVLEDGQLATSMSGTKPYIAPEIYMCSCEEYGVLGYGFAVDWWSLGILAWETLAMERPYPLHSTTSNREALRILQDERSMPSHWSPSIRDLLDRLLTLAPSARVSCLKELKQVSAMRDLDFDKVLNKQIKPRFTPPKDHLNCDPTFELEEMIIETKPLHKKKKRLAKQRSVAFT
ncbi:serine/threonine-protein kinase 32B isoform X3 [Pogonomyrmex barbatus]|nr:serine/threonine-protein kinase 32B isoform X3 [Pogonomyrmex barbatus]